MRVVMFIVGVISVLVGLLLLLLFEEKDGKKAQAAIALFLGATLLILGSGLGDRVQNVKVSEAGMEMAFAPQPAALTPQQVAGAQQAQAQKITATPQQLTSAQNTRAQTISLAPRQSTALLAGSGSDPLKNFEAMLQRQREATATLHQALAGKGFTPTADPEVNLIPGSVVRVAADGKISVQYTWRDAFPDLKVRRTNFDFAQFTSLGGTKTGFTHVGLINCQQGFQEDMDLMSYVFTPISATVDTAMRADASLHVVKSVLGCYGTEGFVFLGQQQPAAQTKHVLGFQLGTPLRR